MEMDRYWCNIGTKDKGSGKIPTISQQEGSRKCLTLENAVIWIYRVKVMSKEKVQIIYTFDYQGMEGLWSEDQINDERQQVIITQD